jgi:hypothetical protein
MKKSKTENLNEFKLFKKAYKDEFKPANKRFEKALKEYEQSMKEFVIKNITGKKQFNKAYKDNFNFVRESYRDEQASDHVDDKIALEFFINFHFDYFEE